MCAGSRSQASQYRNAINGMASQIGAINAMKRMREAEL
jgi:hypothetical protein